MLNSTSVNSTVTDLPDNNQDKRPIERERVNRILLAVDADLQVKNEFLIRELTFFCVPIERAVNNAEDLRPETIMISFKPHIQFNENIRHLKHYADEHSIPFVLYSAEYDKEAKQMALGLKFDDYYYGELNESLARKFRMIKKSKELKSIKNDHHQNDEHNQEHPNIGILRRSFDIAASVAILMILSPVLVLIAIIIKLESRGPVFYISKRAGNNYRIFDFYKFRTMRNGADAELKKLSASNQYGKGVFVKIKNDPRVTRFGRFLRKTSLDEIPQLINVVKGDMSLVGNRPLPLYEAEQLTKDGAARRFLAPAGVTGLWQITKRGKDQMSEQERIQLDIEYAKNFSTLYDFRILVHTLPALLQKEAV